MVRSSREMSSTRDRHLNVTIVAHEVGTLGGMESQIAILVQGLLAAGIRVTLVTRRCLLAEHPLLRVHRVRSPRRSR